MMPTPLQTTTHARRRPLRTAGTLLALTLALPLLLTACGGGDNADTADGSAGAGADDATTAGPVVIALKPQKDPDRMLEDRRRLAAYLQEQLGREADVVVPASTQVIIEGLRGGTIDVAYLSATNMVRNRDAAEILFAEEIAGQTHYESYWVALADADLASVEDLRGRPVAFASRTSTSGFVVPLWHLRERGLIAPDGHPEDFFGEGNVIFGTGYVSAVERVLSGEAVAAAVSNYVLDRGEHLDPATRQRLKIVDRQGPVPTHVLVARTTLPASERAAIKAALAGLNAPEHHGVRDAVFVDRLVEVDPDAHLGALPAALAFAEQVAR
jgi:phosphonate transport system substrate-binding protein